MMDDFKTDELDLIKTQSTTSITETSQDHARHTEPRRRLKWDKSYTHSDDSLAMCLEIMSDILGRPMSAAAFKTGLPLQDNRMAPEHYVRAAKKAGLSARIVYKKINDLSSLILPCVLLLNNDKACIVTRILNDGQFEIIFPETGKGVTTILPQDIELYYTGYAIFTRPLYAYDERSSDLDIEKPRSWFWGVIFKFWPVYNRVIAAALFVNIFATVTPLFSMNVYDRVVPHNATDTLIVLSVGIILIYVFDFVLKMLRVFFVDEAGKNADVLLASRLFQHVMNVNLASRPTSSGSFANQLREYESLREFFSSVSVVALLDLPFIFLFLGIIAMIGGPLAWVPAISVPIVIIGSMLFHNPLQAWVKRSFREAAQKHGMLVEAINGIETIKSFTAEGQMQRNWEVSVAQSANSSKYLKFFAAMAMNWSAFVQQVAYVAVIIVGVALISTGELSMGGLIACSILTSRALAPLSQIVGLLTRLNQSQAALESLDKIMQMPTEHPQGVHYLHRPVLSGQINFQNVTFTYRDQKIPALKNFNCAIKEGEKIGILGRIGSGKSTLEKLMLNLYAPQEGTIKLDNTDISQIDPADIRRSIGYVPQDIFLFYGTIRDNIMFGARDVHEGAVVRAAEIAGVIDFIRAHPQGFDMMIGEGGFNLSGGQRQAVAIARALVRNPSLYLFDEPTAMMDHMSENQFITRFNHIVGNNTLILITHRMPLLQIVDRLIVIDHGAVVADGPRETVLAAISNAPIRTS